MFDKNWDPYDALIDLNERLLRLESAHNTMAAAFHKTEQEFSQLLTSHHNLQKAYLSMANLINSAVMPDNKV